MSVASAENVIRLRSLIGTVYLPAALYMAGTAAAAPVIALTARELGASVAAAGLMVALWGLGQVIGDLPAGALVARLGERKAIMASTFLAVIGVLIALFAQDLWVFAIGLFLKGLANAVWGLARMSYLSSAVPVKQRARAMSLFGGSSRVGAFVGPLIGAAVIMLVGTRGGFLVQLVAVILAGLLMLRLSDPAGPRPKEELRTVLRVAFAYRRLLTTLGLGAVCIGAARASRDAILPLWGEHIGLEAAVISVIFGIGALIDVACAYPAGLVMDRLGRRIVTVPALLVMSLAYATLPLSSSLFSFILVVAVLGLGNGFSTGIIFVLGADTSPAQNRAEYLAAWKLTHDIGHSAGPLSIAGVAAVAALSAAPIVLSVTSLLGAGLMARYIPRYSNSSRTETHNGSRGTS